MSIAAAWAEPSSVPRRTVSSGPTARRSGSVWEIRPWHEPSGAIGGIVIFSEDITDRKGAEVELRQSRDQLARLAENLPHSIVFQVTLDTSGQRRFSYFSGAIELALGIPAEDVMADANALYQWILEPFRPVLERLQAASTQNRSPLDVELPFREGWVR